MEFRFHIPILAGASFTLWSALVVAAGAGPGTPAVDAPTGTITLADAAYAALARSPELAAASWDLHAQDARTLQAGLLPNPEMRFQAEDFGGSGSRPGFERTETTLSIAQLIELGGKRARRRELAVLGRALADWTWDATRLDLLARVTRSFVAVVAAQERLALTTELLALARESERAAARLVSAGATSPVDRLRADVVVSRVEAERTVRTRELDAARAALAATWSGSPATFTEARGNLEAIAPPPPLDALADRLLDGPQLARWRTELAREQAAVAVEEARRIPDVTLRLGGRRFEDDGSLAMVGELAIPLPLFDRNQGGVAEARAHLGRAEAQRQAAEAAAGAALSAAWQDLAAAYDEASSLRARVLPAAQAAYDQTRAAYGQGLLRSVDVLDAQRTLFELRGDRLRALAAYHTAAAEVERLTGAPLAAGPTEAP